MTAWVTAAPGARQFHRLAVLQDLSAPAGGRYRGGSPGPARPAPRSPLASSYFEIYGIIVRWSTDAGDSPHTSGGRAAAREGTNNGRRLDKRTGQGELRARRAARLERGRRMLRHGFGLRRSDHLELVRRQRKGGASGSGGRGLARLR